MIYQVKINLAYIKPPVLRRIEISSETSLEDLHKIIQASIEDFPHLHETILFLPNPLLL